MVGDALLVRAVVEKDTYNVNVDLPSGDDKVTIVVVSLMLVVRDLWPCSHWNSTSQSPH